MSFYFLGKGPCSKSLLLRALVVQSYFPDLKIIGDSYCDDVLSMRKGLKNLQKKHPINDLHGGAVLRFLALRASRLSGQFILKGTSRLFQRPIRELQTILSQLSCEVKWEKDSLVLKSSGWLMSGDALTVSSSCSSQFASAVLLNSWNLNRDLFVNIEGNIVSSSYFQMTLCFLRSLGMKIDGENREYCVPAGQKINQFIYQPEQDMSCLFSLAAMVLVGGEVVFIDWPEQSLQPDFQFPSILQKMGFQIIYQKKTLKIMKRKTLKPINFNLKNCPDLFPVLSALCAMAEGTSYLYGAPQLIYKESNRIEQTAKLLRLIGRTVKVLKDGLIIKGRSVVSEQLVKNNPIFFDSKEDHRMAMAAAVLKKTGWPIHILNPQVVNKSFPGFWSCVDVVP